MGLWSTELRFVSQFQVYNESRWHKLQDVLLDGVLYKPHYIVKT